MLAPGLVLVGWVFCSLVSVALSGSYASVVSVESLAKSVCVCGGGDIKEWK